MISPLLREPTFRRFWTGKTTSLFGDQISLFAIPLTAVLAGGTLGGAIGLSATVWVSVIGATSCVGGLIGSPLLKVGSRTPRRAAT